MFVKSVLNMHVLGCLFGSESALVVSSKNFLWSGVCTFKKAYSMGKTKMLAKRRTLQMLQPNVSHY